MIALEVFTILDDDVAVLEVDVVASSAPLVVVTTSSFTPSMFTVSFQDRKFDMSSSLNIAVKSLLSGPVSTLDSLKIT